MDQQQVREITKQRGLFKIRVHNQSKSIGINDRPVDKVEQAKYDW